MNNKPFKKYNPESDTYLEDIAKELESLWDEAQENDTKFLENNLERLEEIREYLPFYTEYAPRGTDWLINEYFAAKELRRYWEYEQGELKDEE